MSRIIDPSTGMPAMGNNPSQYQISNADLVKVLTTQRMRIDMLNQQNMQLGLYVEFVLEALLNMTDSEGEPLFSMDVSEFPAFAEKRMAEIQDEITEQQTKVETQAAQSLLDSIPEGLGTPSINLNE